MTTRAEKVGNECQFFVRIRAKRLVYFDTNSKDKYDNKKLREREYVFKKVQEARVRELPDEFFSALFNKPVTFLAKP